MRLELDVNPEMMKRIRQDNCLALSTLKNLTAVLQKVEQFESGELKPTWTELKLLSKLYKQPSYMYFLEEPLEKYDGIKFKISEAIGTDLDSKSQAEDLLTEIDKYYTVVNVTIDFSNINQMSYEFGTRYFKLKNEIDKNINEINIPEHIERNFHKIEQLVNEGYDYYPSVGWLFKKGDE